MATSTTVNWKPLTKQFENINKSFINLEANEKRLFTEHFNQVYRYVTDSMGEVDEFFKTVFQRQQLAGSYADRIKVGQPNEYDALMILDFPDPVVVKTRPGFVKINIREGISKRTIDKQNYQTLVDTDGFLLQDKVLDWLRKLIYEVMKRCDNVIRIERNEYSVTKHTMNGPAVTLVLTIKKCAHGTAQGNFSIDFVGALAFDFQKKWFADFKPGFLTAKNWNAIAKPNKTNQHKNREWTCSYADMEREYLRDTKTLKQLIRYFKKIRDTHNLTNLKSYYIKVMFLHQRKKHDNDFWTRPLGTLFGEMFEVILKHVESRTLLSFWHKDYNLFGELSVAQTNDIFNKLKSIRETIEKNLVNKDSPVDFINSVILTKTELAQLKRMQTPGPGMSVAATTNDVCKVNDNKSCEIS